jgi:hypothetical protein
MVDSCIVLIKVISKQVTEISILEIIIQHKEVAKTKLPRKKPIIPQSHYI